LGSAAEDFIAVTVYTVVAIGGVGCLVKLDAVVVVTADAGIVPVIRLVLVIEFTYIFRDALVNGCQFRCQTRAVIHQDGAPVGNLCRASLISLCLYVRKVSLVVSGKIHR